MRMWNVFSFSLLLILLFGEAINIALHNNIHKVHGYKARLERFYFSCFGAASVLYYYIVRWLRRGGHTIIQTLSSTFFFINSPFSSLSLMLNRCRCPIAVIASRIYNEYAAGHVLRSQLENFGNRKNRFGNCSGAGARQRTRHSDIRAGSGSIEWCRCRWSAAISDRSKYGHSLSERELRRTRRTEFFLVCHGIGWSVDSEKSSLCKY